MYITESMLGMPTVQVDAAYEKYLDSLAIDFPLMEDTLRSGGLSAEQVAGLQISFEGEAACKKHANENAQYSAKKHAIQMFALPKLREARGYMDEDRMSEDTATYYASFCLSRTLRHEEEHVISAANNPNYEHERRRRALRSPANYLRVGSVGAVALGGFVGMLSLGIDPYLAGTGGFIGGLSLGSPLVHWPAKKLELWSYKHDPEEIRAREAEADRSDGLIAVTFAHLDAA